MCNQFKRKAILLTCLCLVDTSALGLHCKAVEGSYSRDWVSRFDNGAECSLWHKLGGSGHRWHSSGRGLEKAANCPSFNTDLTFRKLGAGEFSAFLFLPRLPFPHSVSLLLSECNPWQWKVTSFLQHPPLCCFQVQVQLPMTSCLVAVGNQTAWTWLWSVVSFHKLPPYFSLFDSVLPSSLKHAPPFSPCTTEASPPESSSHQLFSAVGRCSPAVLAGGWAGGKVGWQGHNLNRSICQGTAGKAETSVPHSGWGCNWPTRLS